MKKLTKRIRIVAGCFEGNCCYCVYADWSDTDNKGRVRCKGGYGGYNKPGDRKDCKYYKG